MWWKSSLAYVHLLSADQHGILVTKGPTLYPSCTGHSDCGTNQFCGVKCWTGGCGEGKKDPKGKKHKDHDNFCQPCAHCKKHPDSVTRGCDICKVAGWLVRVGNVRFYVFPLSLGCILKVNCNCQMREILVVYVNVIQVVNVVDRICTFAACRSTRHFDNQRPGSISILHLALGLRD